MQNRNRIKEAFRNKFYRVMVLFIAVFSLATGVIFFSRSYVTARPGNGNHSSSSSSNSSGSSSNYHQDDYDNSDSDTETDTESQQMSPIETVILISVFAIVFVGGIYITSAADKKKKKGKVTTKVNRISRKANRNKINDVLDKIKEKDPEFSEAMFISNINELFMFIYSAWEKRDLSKLRVYETDSLFSLHKGMIQEFIDRKEINKLENICIRSIEIIGAETAQTYNSIKVLINATLYDYTINEEIGKIVHGSKKEMSSFIEKWTLIRKSTVTSKSEQKLQNCPNCGAPLDITSEGECNYCKTITTKGDYGWVLSNIEQVNVD